jgi:hypothetical protein
MKLIMRLQLLISGEVGKITSPKNKKMTDRGRLALVAGCSEYAARKAIHYLNKKTEPPNNKKRGRPTKKMTEKKRALKHLSEITLDQPSGNMTENS